jgi:hypothetical protein
MSLNAFHVDEEIMSGAASVHGGVNEDLKSNMQNMNMNMQCLFMV